MSRSWSALALAALLTPGFTAPPLEARQQDPEPLTEQLLALTQNDPFRITALITAAGHFSFEDDDFRGGRAFRVDHARLGVGGALDGGFDYRFQFEFAREPNLLDAYVGYRLSERANLRVGAQKPQITAELLPSPAGTDFMDRARLVGAQLRAREVGVSLFGDLEGLRYDLGLYNGTGVATNVDNRFLFTGRVAHDVGTAGGAPLTAGFNLAYGQCQAAQCGLSGFTGNGSRRTLGGDVRYESDRWIVAGEILSTTMEVVAATFDEERILGYYLTGGYKLSDQTVLLARWDRLEFRELDQRNSLIVLGLDHGLTRLMTFQMNLLTLVDGDADNQTGLSAGLQFVF
jgi:hypothetical protein